MPSLPPGTKQTVIVDTNGYRGLFQHSDLNQTRQKVRALRTLEQRQGIIALAHPVPIQELISHLADPSDPHFSNCLHGLVCLVEHTNAPPDVGGGIRLLADHESTVCQTLSERIPPEHENFSKVLCALAAHVAKRAPCSFDAEALGQIELISQTLEENERIWVNLMKGVLQKHGATGVAPWEFGSDVPETQRKIRAFFDSERFVELLAAAMVLVHVQIARIEISNEELSNMTKVVFQEFRTPLNFLNRILTKMAVPGGYTLEHHKENRGNNLWDFQICFAIGGKIDGSDILDDQVFCS
jgi:hypothetical protein